MAEKKFLDFLDRFDGGGMGKSGEKFEGGGLLSMLGNLFADPYGSDDKDRMASRNAFYGSQDIGGPAMTPAPTATSNNQTVSARPAPPTDAQRFGMNPPADYSPAPVNVGAPPSYTPHSSMQTPVNYGQGSGMPNTGMTAIPGYTTPASDMPNTGMTAIPGYTTEDPRQRFASQLVEMIGPDAAESMMNSGMGEQAYQAFVANNYNMPNY